MEKILYFDCLAGISGDMTIGALLDLGVDQEEFVKELKKIDLTGYQLEIGYGQKNGISGTDFNVIVDQQEHHHRSLQDIKDLITTSSLNEDVKDLSCEIFELIAKAEAKIHNQPLSEVQFHEVGAIDSIIDIVGAAICIDKLEVDRIYSSPLHLGRGFVNCAHGKLPVPAPATLEILQDVAVYSKGVESELVTPTGAAIIKVLATDFIPYPEMVVEQVGYGLGSKELEISNLLRVTLGKKKVKKL
nr:nickel pincer cofactor biosynthesis protein LarC [Natroniella sulfidigena]